MKYKSLLLTLALSSVSFAGDVEFGKELYEDTMFSKAINGQMRDDVTCAECHTPGDFTKADRKADSYAKLHYWVDACNHAMSSGWFPEEVDDVTAYLNKEYYKFPEQ